MKLTAISIQPRRGDRRGVALVITLIMLAIVTVFAIAFLAVARRERVSVSVKQDLDDSRLANDAANARALAEILGRMASTTNLWDYDIINSYNQDGGAFFSQNPPGAGAIATLTNDARPPVFVPLPGGGLDFRFYLDLNRNGIYDTNLYNPTPLGGVLRYDEMGDPLWVGQLERPGEAHSRSNRFLGRYAYLALPLSKSLDVNFVFNNSKGIGLGAGNPPPAIADGFLRNHGYGNWEFNLAAFLNELHPGPGAWAGYSYSPVGPNAGFPFVSANDILRYRYASNSFPLFSLAALHPPVSLDAEIDGIDAYADGPLIGGTTSMYDRPSPPNPPPRNDDPSARWPGSLSSNVIRNFDEFVDVAERSRYPRFHDALTNIMRPINPPNSFDRTTLYRMLAQMGTDSVGSEPIRFLRSTNSFSTTGQLDVFQLPGDIVAVVTNLVGHGYNPGEWVRVATGNPTNVFATYRVVRTWTDSFWLDAFPLPTTPPVTYTFQRNNQINLNYNNLTEVETNFVLWTPQRFFTNVADRLLRQCTNYGLPPGFSNAVLSLTNIPVYPTNHYTPRVHQLLQIAANLYDATTTNDFPSIFRPHFVKTPANEVYVSGYSLVTGTNILIPAGQTGANPRVPLDRLATNAVFFPANYTNLVVFGVPPVVGTKKHLPNFNELAMSTAMQAVRRLQIVRPATNQPPNQTNQMFLLSLTNSFSAEFWHPYNRTYPNTVSALLELTSEATLTNELGFFLRTNFPFISSQVLPPGSLGPYGFQLAVTNAVHPVLPLAAYFRGTPPYAGFIAPNTFVPITNLLGSSNFAGTITNIPFEKGVPLYEPRWVYSVTNRVFFALVDELHNRIIDLVAIEGLSMRTNLNDVLASSASSTVQVGNGVQRASMRDFWIPGVVGSNGASPGMIRQIAVSRNPNLAQGQWNQFQTVNVPANASTNFNRWLTAPVVRAAETNFQVPLTPGETLWMTYRWQVDDPIVHYVAENYTSFKDGGLNPHLDRPETYRAPTPPVFSTIGRVNERYRPWGGHRKPSFVAGMGTADFANADDYAFWPNMKDPNVRVPDEWDFPTNSYGNVGWIGRVHRGTPWQTIYLKSGEVNTNDWLVYRNTFDTYPTNDWSLVDLFTVNIDENARRGLVSVNQTNRAAWAAALAAMPVLITNTALYYDGTSTNPVPAMPDRFIAPNSPEFDAIYNGIQNWRNAQTKGVFTNLGAFLGTMELSVGNVTNSPFLPTNAPPLVMDASATHNWRYFPLTDVAAERIPQQLLSMVHLENPVRFAIYAWGQSLRPADRSLVNVPGPTFQLCTNYQITGEVVTKSIVRIEPRVITDWPGATNNVTNLNIVVESYEVLQNP